MTLTSQLQQHIRNLRVKRMHQSPRINSESENFNEKRRPTRNFEQQVKVAINLSTNDESNSKSCFSFKLHIFRLTRIIYVKLFGANLGTYCFLYPLAFKDKSPQTKLSFFVRLFKFPYYFSILGRSVVLGVQIYTRRLGYLANPPLGAPCLCL